jgi:hypothetical protein
VASLLVLLPALALGPSARADDAPADDHADLHGLIADAVAEYDAGRFEEARALFRRAHAESPSARTLRGIGMASFELRDYVEATRALEAAEREQRHALTPEQRHHVQGLLARAQTFVGRFTPRLQPADATLAVDGKPATLEPDGTLLLPFGRHLLVAQCPTCVAAERQIEVMGGERQEAQFALAPAQAAAATVRATSVAPPPPAATERASPGGSSAAAPWLGAVALATAAGAVGSGFWWHDRSSKLDVCRAAGDRCENEPVVARESNLAAGVTLGLGAVALGSAITAAILYWSHRDPGAAHAFACSGGRNEVSCAFAF